VVEHTVEVLSSVGYSEEAIRGLLERKAALDGSALNRSS